MVPIRYNIRNLFQRKGTTLMTAVGIALTVAVLVTTLALTNGMAAVFAGSGHPRQALVMRESANAELSSTVKEDAWQVIRTLPGIEKDEAGQVLASPEVLTVVNIPSVESPEGMNVTVRGMLPVGFKMRETAKLKFGQWSEPGQRQIVVGSGIAARYPAARVGQTLKFGRGEWKVVGEFTDGESSANSEMWTDLNQLRGDFEQSGGANVVLVRLDADTPVETFRESVKSNQQIAQSSTPSVTSQAEYFKSLKNDPNGQLLQFIGFFVAIVMAIGAGFAATNTMYAAVSRRSREIGTLRALGFSRFSILLSFVFEAVCLALIGGVIGCMIALPLNNLSAGIGNWATFSEMSFKFKIDYRAILAGLVFAGFIGFVGGFLPAFSAARRGIVQAMREA
jgi:ABC-type lipoprotein release transport system permease subunit